MSWKFALLWAVALSVCCVAEGDTGESNLFLKYKEHRTIVRVLDNLRKSESIEKFQLAYEKDYMNSTKWIWKVLVDDYDFDGLVKEAKKHYNYHYGHIKTFLDDTITTFDAAVRVEIAFLKLRKEPFHLVEKQNSLWRNEILIYIQYALEDLVTTEWLAVAKQDVHRILQSRRSSLRIANELVGELKDKYPFRTWFVYIEGTSKPTVFCAPESLRLLPPQVFRNPNLRIAHVLHVDPIFKPIDTDAILSRISHTKWVSPFKCQERSLKIFEQMNYGCEAFLKAGMTAGVFPIDGDSQAVKASDTARLRVHQVKRKFWKFCSQDYAAFIFQ